MVADEQRDHRPQEPKEEKRKEGGGTKAEEVFQVCCQRNGKKTSQKVAFPKSSL